MTGRGRDGPADAERHLDHIITNAEEGFVILDADGGVLRWSRGAEAILGIPEADIIGKPFSSIVRSEVQRRRLTDRLRGTSEAQSVTSVEYRYTRPSGHDVQLSISTLPIRDRGGKVKETLVIIKDLTEKKHLEERLKESEKRLATEVIKRIEDLKYVEQLNRLVVRYMQEGAFLLDGKMYIGFVNPKILDILGYTEEELTSKAIGDIVPEDLLWAWLEIPDRSKRESYRFESSLVGKDGEEVPVMVTASSIRIEAKRSEFLCTVIDLTEQKRKEEALREEMMEYKVKRGSVHLLLEKGYSKLAGVLGTLRRFGHSVILISRRSSRDSIDELTGDETEVYWLEETGRGNRSLPPSKEGLTAFLQKKVGRTSVVVLDRLDYLVSKIGFGETIALIHRFVELFYHRKATLILMVDPSTLGEAEMAQLEKDASVLEPKRAFILPDELQEILQYINQQTKMGAEPTYKDIGTRFNITKTTTRKRIQQLVILELLVESKRGRSKVLRITEKGNRFVPPVIPRIR